MRTIIDHVNGHIAYLYLLVVLVLARIIIKSTGTLYFWTETAFSVVFVLYFLIAYLDKGLDMHPKSVKWTLRAFFAFGVFINALSIFVSYMEHIS